MRPYEFRSFARHGVNTQQRIGVAANAGVDATPLDINAFPAFDLSYHNPYDVPFFMDLPPSWVRGDIALDQDGAVVLGSRLGPLMGDSAQLHLAPQKAPRGPYGDMQSIRVVIPALGSLRVLPRPTFKRLLLQIQNNDALNNMNYRFGGAASANDFTIGAGGSSSFLQAVPQNELWVFSAAGATIVIGYIDSMTPDAPSEALQ